MFYNHNAIKLEISKHLSGNFVQRLEIKYWVKQKSWEDRTEFELNDWKAQQPKIWDVMEVRTEG